MNVQMSLFINQTSAPRLILCMSNFVKVTPNIVCKYSQLLNATKTFPQK